MPLKKTMEFDDGSRLTYTDRETVVYEEDGRSVLVWVDYEARGFFRRAGRVVRASSLVAWSTFPEGEDPRVPVEVRHRIVERIAAYFGATPVRVDS